MRISYIREAQNASSVETQLLFLRDLHHAFRRPVTVSSVVYAENAAQCAVDGRMDTRWSSEFSDPQWIVVDLGYLLWEIVIY